ncbi:hypothetical protein BV898_02238 [Hypsibius exemplaris]|uniref:Uncharacterized protein n=1 Tax=Hypsibius exemplaris TaxID=2072580 RepID=A0A1W0X8M7_HYPEX|nr:hypothetical protein BV898_02238 [Hypsibius exemplaris]
MDMNEPENTALPKVPVTLEDSQTVIAVEIFPPKQFESSEASASCVASSDPDSTMESPRTSVFPMVPDHKIQFSVGNPGATDAVEVAVETVFESSINEETGCSNLPPAAENLLSSSAFSSDSADNIKSVLGENIGSDESAQVASTSEFDVDKKGGFLPTAEASFISPSAEGEASGVFPETLGDKIGHGTAESESVVALATGNVSRLGIESTSENITPKDQSIGTLSSTIQPVDGALIEQTDVSTPSIFPLEYEANGVEKPAVPPCYAVEESGSAGAIEPTTPTVQKLTIKIPRSMSIPAAPTSAKLEQSGLALLANAAAWCDSLAVDPLQDDLEDSSRSRLTIVADYQPDPPPKKRVPPNQKAPKTKKRAFDEPDNEEEEMLREGTEINGFIYYPSKKARPALPGATSLASLSALPVATPLVTTSGRPARQAAINNKLINGGFIPDEGINDDDAPYRRPAPSPAKKPRPTAVAPIMDDPEAKLAKVKASLKTFPSSSSSSFDSKKTSVGQLAKPVKVSATAKQRLSRKLGLK